MSAEATHSRITCMLGRMACEKAWPSRNCIRNISGVSRSRDVDAHTHTREGCTGPRPKVLISWGPIMVNKGKAVQDPRYGSLLFICPMIRLEMPDRPKRLKHRGLRGTWVPCCLALARRHNGNWQSVVCGDTQPNTRDACRV